MLGLNISSDQLRKQAVGYYEYDMMINDNKQCVDNRILSISDAHIPFNLPLSIFHEYIDKVDTLVLNGDIEDCQSCSKFPKQYRINMDHEMILTREYIIDLINMIHPTKVIVVKGNHEHRMSRYLTDRLHADILSIMPDSPMELIINKGFHVKDLLNKTETWYAPLYELFREQNIEIIYNGNWWHKIGKTIFAHPLSYSSGMLKTTEKAVNYFLRNDRDFNCIVLGHTHKLGSYYQGNIKMYEQGCCCDLSKLVYNDGYLTLPNQNGFIYICQDVNGNVISNCTKLIDI